MDISISRNIEGYFAEPSLNDGIRILHIEKEDADIIESIVSKYGFKCKKHRLNDNTVYVEAGDEIEIRQPEDSNKVSKTKPKKMWINKKGELKKILPEELNEYTSNGWKVGRNS